MCVPEQSKHEPERCEQLPIFLLKGCEYWFLGLPQCTGTMPILTLSILFSICKSTCASAQATETTVFLSHLRLTFSEKPLNWLCHPFWEEGKAATCSPQLRSLFPCQWQSCVTFLGFCLGKVFSQTVSLHLHLPLPFKLLWINGVSGRITPSRRLRIYLSPKGLTTVHAKKKHFLCIAAIVFTVRNGDRKSVGGSWFKV